MEINHICRIGHEAVIVPQNKEGLIMTFTPIDARKLDIPRTDNLLVQLNIKNYILKRVLIDPAANVSILYKEAFIKRVTSRQRSISLHIL